MIYILFIFGFSSTVLSRRSKRQKNVHNAESSKSAGEVTIDIMYPAPKNGNRASYHCDYCNKDITGVARIKCAVCVDFDLCVECFSVGVEIHPHKSNHPYRVMGLDIYGPSNWAEVAVHVGTKTKEECHTHYTEIYLDSPNYPLPDMSLIVVKPKEPGANMQGATDAEQENSSGAAAGCANKNEAVPESDEKAPEDDSVEAAPGKQCP
uniref:ZZ-type domain-containing protein n=1 Tax=Kalanchoe fedtschenkoi TaxID=63787 RepID=A0A7N1A2B7_KALFE